MGKGVNKVIIIGNLGKDPETAYMASGAAVTNFTVATSESWKDKNTGQQQERTEWHNIATFGKLAEICGEYLKKGSKVYIEGSIRTDKQEKEGVTKYYTKIIASEMQMLDSKGGQSAAPRPSQAPAPKVETAVVDGFEDGIPF